MDTETEVAEVTDEVAAQRAAVTARMDAQSGNPSESSPQADYFGTEQTHRVPLPDGVSWVEHKHFTEGEKRLYQNKTNRDVKINKDKSATMKLASGDDRFFLLQTAIVGWNLQKGGQPFAYSPNNKNTFLTEFPPHLVDLVEKDVRAKNKWLVEGADLSTLRQARSDLDDQIAELEKEEEGKGSTSA